MTKASNTRTFVDVVARFVLTGGIRLGYCGLALLCFHATPAAAEERPLWEAGAGITVIDFPHYRGSEERRTWVLPVPYIVYRGEILQMDERRMRGLFFRTENAELDVGVNGSVPVKSGDDGARRGMPDLDGALEIGPSLNFFLKRSADRKAKLDLRLPLRKAIASDFSHFRNIGWLFQPTLNLDLHDAFGNSGWNLGLQGSVLFSSRRYNEYFYSVDSAFATPERPAYEAPGGYAGTQFIAAISKRYPRFWIGGFAKLDRLAGAAFEDSPLVKDKHGFTAGFAIAWILGESKTMVQVRD